MKRVENLKNLMRDIENFPKEGIIFKDITPILESKQGLRDAVDKLADTLEGVDYDILVGPEARGFIFGMPVAYKLNKGFGLIRKPGKLPYKTYSKSYDLEYGTNTLEMHIDTIKKGQKVVVIDDLLATGGTCEAIVDLVNEAGGEVVKFVYLVELEFLEGRKKLKGIEVESILKY